MHHCDLESNALLDKLERIWILVSYDDVTGKWRISFDWQEYEEKPVTDWIPSDLQATVYRGHSEHCYYLEENSVNFHNYFGFDKWAIRHFIPDWQPVGEQDTFILSQLLNPDRPHNHGLADWGERLGIPKPKYEDWAGGLTEDMVIRCIEDVKITHSVWIKLQQEARRWKWQQSVSLEYAIADIMGRQAKNGVYFNVDKGYELAEWVWAEVNKLGGYIYQKMPWVVSPLATLSPFKKDGTLKKAALPEAWGEYCKVEFTPPNINSFTQIKAYLLSVGWTPTSYTEKGSPKITEDSLDTISDELGAAIVKRSIYLHRARMLFNITTTTGELKGLLNIVRDDGRISASALTNGTNTGRMRHRGLVNIPKVKVDTKIGLPFPIRELFCVPEGKLMMGIDADGLEARTEAHACKPFTGGEEYAHTLIDGDVHAKNAVFFGTDRDGAKSPKYALTYGCQPAKLAETIGCSMERAKKMYDQFWSGNTALSEFKTYITKEWKQNKGFIKGVDGRKIRIRSEHSIVNAHFQSTGSIVVKLATVLMDRYCRQLNLSAFQVIHMHDEFSYELPEYERAAVERIASKVFQEAGEMLKINVPITGTPAFGRNWREIH